MQCLRKTFLPVAMFAVVLHGLVLSGCGGGGGSSPTGASGGAEVRMKLKGLAAPRSAVRGARSTAVGGANVLVDGVVVGVTDAGGEIVLQLAPGTHTITVESGGVSSTPFQVTVTEGEVITLDVELEKDGTLVVEQDKDHDGDYDDDDEGNVGDVDADNDDDGEQEDGGGGHSNGTVAIR